MTVKGIPTQSTGRVGLFLRVDDFDAAYQRMLAAGVGCFTAERRTIRLTCSVLEGTVGTSLIRGNLGGARSAGPSERTVACSENLSDQASGLLGFRDSRSAHSRVP